MIGATDRLSRCASALLALVDAEGFAYEEIEALYAPSECVGLVRGGVARDALRVLEAHGYTPRTFEEELARRTCPRFLAPFEVGGALMALLPDDSVAPVAVPDARPGERDRLALCASELLYLARCEYDACYRGEPRDRVRAAVESEAREILARHGYTRDELVRAFEARAARRTEPAERDGWYLCVLPDAPGLPLEREQDHRGADDGESGEYVVTVGFWEEDESYELGTITIAAPNAELARRIGIELLFDDELRGEGCSAWAIAKRRDPHTERAVERKYLVTVGYVDEHGERHIVGGIEALAPSPARAREMGIDELFDERLRAASCRPWARAERFGV